MEQQAPAEKDVLQYNDMSLEDLILFQRYGIKGYSNSEEENEEIDEKKFDSE